MFRTHFSQNINRWPVTKPVLSTHSGDWSTCCALWPTKQQMDKIKLTERTDGGTWTWMAMMMTPNMSNPIPHPLATESVASSTIVHECCISVCSKLSLGHELLCFGFGLISSLLFRGACRRAENLWAVDDMVRLVMRCCSHQDKEQNTRTVHRLVGRCCSRRHWDWFKLCGHCLRLACIQRPKTRGSGPGENSTMVQVNYNAVIPREREGSHHNNPWVKMELLILLFRPQQRPNSTETLNWPSSAEAAAKVDVILWCRCGGSVHGTKPTDQLKPNSVGGVQMNETLEEQEQEEEGINFCSPILIAFSFWQPRMASLRLPNSNLGRVYSWLVVREESPSVPLPFLPLSL